MAADAMALADSPYTPFLPPDEEPTVQRRDFMLMLAAGTAAALGGAHRPA
nr:twin-arginine translocation signal domain-containing protein [Actinomyces sp.]